MLIIIDTDVHSNLARRDVVLGRHPCASSGVFALSLAALGSDGEQPEMITFRTQQSLPFSRFGVLIPRSPAFDRHQESPVSSQAVPGARPQAPYALSGAATR